MKERVLTAIVLLLIVVGALFLDPTGWAVKMLILVIAGVCALEFDRLAEKNASSDPARLSSAFAAASITVVATGTVTIKGINLPFFIYLLIATVSAMIMIWLFARKNSLASIGSILWTIATVIPLALLASTKSPGNWPLLLTAAIPIWCGDTAAIFVGKAFGKHKLAPSISPNKTWEGSIGNLLACIGAALILGAIFHYPMPLMLLLGINCGILGQAGDLFESWLKRKADVKDSGNILPGHGGLLDRLDSLMATAPISLLILQSLVVSGKPT